VLPPKVKEFIYIAIDASVTHLHAPGTRVHIQNALNYGATKEEIMEIFEIISSLGIHSMILGMPILTELTKNQGINKKQD
jgi:alkylhydroperoxidase/carboxymuconolactone decarboxylase family protein YurZ